MQKPNYALWLDDEPKNIEGLCSRVEKKLQIKIEVVSKGRDALKFISSPNPPILFFVDLLLAEKDNNGINIATTAKEIIPFLPMYIVTEHLLNFKNDIFELISSNKYPFKMILDKDELCQERNLQEFCKDLIYIKNSEFHHGIIKNIEADYTLIELTSKNEQKYERYFDTNYLKDCGFEHAEDQVGIYFEKSIVKGLSNYPKFGLINMLIFKNNQVVPPKKKILSDEDRKLFKEKFGSHIKLRSK